MRLLLISDSNQMAPNKGDQNGCRAPEAEMLGRCVTRRYKSKMIELPVLFKFAVRCYYLLLLNSIFRLNHLYSATMISVSSEQQQQMQENMMADYISGDPMFMPTINGVGNFSFANNQLSDMPQLPDYANIFMNDEEPDFLPSSPMQEHFPSQPLASTIKTQITRRQAMFQGADYESYRPLMDTSDHFATQTTNQAATDYYKSPFNNYNGQQQQFSAEALALRSPLLAPGDSLGGNGGGGGSFKQQLVNGLTSNSGDHQQQLQAIPSFQANQQQPSLKIGPQFIREPPSLIHYLNSTDLVIPCLASGNPAPTITWWQNSAQLAPGSLLDKRYVRYDNSLVISAFKPHDFEPEIHSATYRCKASNSLGTIVSRDVVINAVIDQDYEVSVSDQFVSVDNDALFKCQLAPQLRDLFQVVGWLEDGQHLITSSTHAINGNNNNNNNNNNNIATIGQNSNGAPATNGQQLPLRSLGPVAFNAADRAPRRRQQSGAQLSQQLRNGPLLLPDGQLYIPRVQLKDGNKSYRCQIKNLLSGRLSLSSISGRLFVTDANENGASPRIVDGPRAQTVGKLNEQLLLICLAQGSPRPTIRWFRQQASNSEPSVSSSSSSDWLELTNLSNVATLNQQASLLNGGIATANVTVPSSNSQDAISTALGGKYLILVDGNLLLIKSLQLQDQRTRFKCLANNSFGAHQAETELRIDQWPISKLIEVEPKLEFINAVGALDVASASRLTQTNGIAATNGNRQPGVVSQRNQLTINCTIRASASQPLHSIEWLHNGRKLFAISLPMMTPYTGENSAQNFQQQQQATGQQLLLNNGYYSSGSSSNLSMFDDFNQDLTVVEFQQQQQLLADLDQTTASQAVGSDGSLGSGSVVGATSLSKLEQQDASQLSMPLASLSNPDDPDEELGGAMSMGPSEQAAGSGQSRSTQSGKLNAITRLHHTNYMSWQSLRPINKETLLYQLHFSSGANHANPSDSSGSGRLSQLRRALRGSYQCRAHLAKTSLQATSQLLLRDNPPQFVETFTSQLITRQQWNSQVSLKCVASGSPLPEISWTLSGFQVPESSRFRVGDYVTRDGLIVSFVNISSVQVEDGGLYECSASNDVGQLRHLAWLNVTGPAHIRPMPNVSAIAGGSLSIMCPVGGWPIESIGWYQNSSKLPLNHRQKLMPNGTLIISELNEILDSGQYSCQAKSSSSSATLFASLIGQDTTDSIALNHVHVQIKVPPVLEPFSFAKSLHRGQRYNIMCTVVRGDLPVSIRWLKDGRTIMAMATIQSGQQFDPSSNQIASVGDLQQQMENQMILLQANRQQIASGPDEPINQQLFQPLDTTGLVIKQLDPYSSTLTFASLQAHHRGQYTCEATNEAGRANQSSTLVIHVPPEWRIEPKDLSVTVGRTAIIDCQADGFPTARVEWRLSQDLFREPPSEFKPIISSLYMRVFENGSLIIYNTQRTDAGYYLCQANNGVGPGISRVIKLTVHVSAHFKTKIRTELVRRGQMARLRCESIGDPPIEINWLKDKMPLYPSDEPRYLMSKSQLPDGILSELTIGESERQDSALFTCITQNAFGSDDTNIQLVVQGPPDPPEEIRIQELEARSAKLTWTPGHSGNSPLSKNVVMLSISSSLDPSSASSISSQQHQPITNISANGNESSLSIHNLMPLTDYQFHLVAINSLGSSRLQSEPIKFRTQDEAPNAPPVYVKAQALSSRSLKIKWRAAERRVHYGATTGFYVGYKLHPSGSTSSSGQESNFYGATSGSTSSAPNSEAIASTMPMSLQSNSANGQQQQNSNHNHHGLATGNPVPDNGRITSESTFVYKTIEFTMANYDQQQLAISNSSSLNMIKSQTSLQQQQQQQLAEQECQLNGLRRGQKYLIIVQPFNGRGAGPASEPIVAETWRFDVPDPPTLRMVSRTTRSIHLTWRLAGGNKQRSQGSSGSGGGGTGATSSSALGLQARTLAHLRPQQQLRQLVSNSDLDEQSSMGNKISDQVESSNSLDNQLELQQQEEEPVIGFILTRRQLQQSSSSSSSSSEAANNNGNNMQAVELRLPGDHLSQVVDNLACGTRYQFTIAALNSVGASAPSDPLVVKTEGSPPVAPDKSSLLSLNATGSAISINLGSWHNGACQMRSFDILFKASRSKKWQSLTNYELIGSSNTHGDDYSSNALKQPADLQQQANQMAQRSTHGLQPSIGVNQQLHDQSVQPQQQSIPAANGTILLDDLSSSINYDLKIVATNEAGTTEAIYTFNTLGHPISNRLGADLDGPLLIGSNGDQFVQLGANENNDTNLSDILGNTPFGPLLPLLLILILITLALSTSCILIARRRHASGSSCSLSISSASRSNQSTSNYYTTTATTTTGVSVNTPATNMTTATTTGLSSTIGEQQQQLARQRLLQSSNGPTTDCDMDSPTSACNNNYQRQQLFQHHSSTLGPHRLLSSSNAIRLGDIYAPLTSNRHNNHGHQNSRTLDESSYATSYHQNNSANVKTTDTTANGDSSELNMCLGASAMNMGQQQLELQQTGEGSQVIENGSGDHQTASLMKQQQNLASGAGYYITPGMLINQNQHSIQQQLFSKSSTLPSNCAQQQHMMQQLLEQQSGSGQQQQLIESLVAANNLLQQQQQHSDGVYNFQTNPSGAAGGFGPQMQTMEQQKAALAELMLLEQQQHLQQQNYATVKRGCPRPARLYDYGSSGDGYQAHYQQATTAPMVGGCCDQRNCNLNQQQQQQLQENQCQQTQTNDYQQLRPSINRLISGDE